MLEFIIGAALAVGTMNIARNMKKDVKIEFVETTKEIKEVKPAIKPPATETIHRLDALEHLLQKNQPIGASTEHIAVNMLYITEGIRYHFHYLHRPQPFLTLTFNKAKQQVNRDYVMEELTEDKARIKDIVKRIGDKIIAEHGEQNEVLSQLKEQSDPVYKKAHAVLTKLQSLENVILPSEAEEIKNNVANILAAYEPLKEETRKAMQDDIFVAIGKMETRLHDKEVAIENEKAKRLQEQLNKI